MIQNTGSSDYKIRAHHLLCMQGFQGYGYNLDFERNLEELIKYLESHPHCNLEVVAEADVICDKCPHLKDGRCIKSSTILEMDLRVLKKLNMVEGTIDTARNLFSQINSRINGDIQEICGECSWRDKCTLYLAL